jgi:hypothetical protein
MTRKQTSLAAGDVSKSTNQPSQQSLDDDALSRMDDEGGSNNPSVNPSDAAGDSAPGS